MILERTTVHISDDTGRIAMLEKRTMGTDDSPPTLNRYVYSNHLQSASLELDGSANIISYEEYHPYGTTAYQAKNSAINAVAKRYRYTGKERDDESGLYYHGARYYIPWLCRWTAVDPMESKYAGRNPYCYSANNPIIFNDPDGMQEKKGGNKSERTFENRVPAKENYFPTGYQNELMPKHEMQYNDSDGMGYVQILTDTSTGRDFSVLRYVREDVKKRRYSYVSSNTGEAEIFYNDKRNKNSKGEWTGYWKEFTPAEDARASAGISGANILAKGVGYGTMGGVAAIGTIAAIPYVLSLGGAVGTTSVSTSVAGSSSTTLTMGGTLGGLTAQEAAKIGLASSLSLLYLNYASQTGTSSIDYTDAVNNAPDHPEKDFFIKYTNAEGLAKFLSEGVLRPNDKGKVYLTKEFFSPEQVERDIFLSQEYGKGRGDYMLIFFVDPDQSANIQKAETDPYEWTYSPGSLKIRAGNLLYMGLNPKR